MKTGLKLRQRTARKGPETRLISAALQRGLPVAKSGLMLAEPELPTGAPDLVAVEPRRASLSVSPHRLRIRSHHLRVLFFLHENGGAKSDEIAKLLNLRRVALERILDDLAAADLIRATGGIYYGRPKSKIFAARRIVAIEAKVADWRSAIQQAVANFWFASHSYILLPALKCLNKVIEAAKQAGVGVLVFDGRKTRRVVPPKKQAIPASYGSWLLNEWAVHQLS